MTHALTQTVNVAGIGQISQRETAMNDWVNALLQKPEPYKRVIVKTQLGEFEGSWNPYFSREVWIAGDGPFIVQSEVTHWKDIK
ncbi:MAG: hypothetical protein ABSG90_11695 [Dehalococcoidia bacterium]|jgi:hypothetical protein